MRKLVCLIGWLTIASSCQGAVAFVQFSTSSNSANTTTAATMTVTAGDLIICCTTRGNNETLTFSDDNSGSWSNITNTGGTAPTWDGGSDFMQMAYSKNHAAGLTHAKATGTGVHVIEIHCNDYSGAGTSVAIDSFSYTTGATSGRVQTSSMTTTIANDVLFACGFSANSITANGAWTSRETFNGDLTEDTAAAVAGPWAGIAQNTTAVNFGLMVAAIEPPTASTVNQSVLGSNIISGGGF